MQHGNSETEQKAKEQKGKAHFIRNNGPRRAYQRRLRSGGGGEAGAEASSLLASAAAAGQNGTALEQARRSRRVLALRVRGGSGEWKGEGAGEEAAAAVACLDAVLEAGLGLAAAAPRTGRRGRGVPAQGLGVAPPPPGLGAREQGGGKPGAAEQRAASGNAQRSRAAREVASEAERIESELGKGAARDGILRKASGSAGRVERRRRRVEGGTGRRRDFYMLHHGRAGIFGGAFTAAER